MATRTTKQQQKAQKQQQGSSSDTNAKVVEKRKPVFTKVDQLKPGTNGHNLTVNVLKSEPVLPKNRAASPQLRQTRIAECLVGDDTGTILFTARNDQGLLSLSFFNYWHLSMYVFFFLSSNNVLRFWWFLEFWDQLMATPFYLFILVFIKYDHSKFGTS